jgi:hypothetical protein
MIFAERRSTIVKMLRLSIVFAFRKEIERAPRCMGAFRQNTKRLPRCMGSISQNAKRAPRCIGTLPEHAKRAPRCMGTLFAEIGPQKWVPEKAPNYVFEDVFEHLWSSTGAPTLCTPRNGSAQVDAKKRPSRSHQTFIFKHFVANVVLRAPLGGHLRRGLHFENMQYRIGFVNVCDPSLSPCWTIERQPQNKKRVPRCMGTLRHKTEQAPRCMGTCFIFLCSSWGSK